MKAVYWFLLLCVLACKRGILAQDVKVIVLDALDGKPQANVEVEYICAGPPRNAISNKTATTNGKGLANLSTLCNDKQDIEVSVFPPNKKEQCGGDAGFKYTDIVSVGFVSRPDSGGGIWCPTKVSRTLRPVPGQVIIFVKRPTWWQSHVAG